MTVLSRVFALILKELLVILRDPRGRVILIVPPLFQLIIFAFAATLEVKNVDVAVFNRDTGRSGTQLSRTIAGSPTFRSVTTLHNPRALRDAVDLQRVLVGIDIPPTFSRDLFLGHPPSVQVLLDGRRANASQIVDVYVSSIIGDFVTTHTVNAWRLPRLPVLVVRNRYNPNLEFRWFTIPGLIAIIAQLVGLIVTALSVARERELGTFDQLMVAPLRTHEILLGKSIPPMLIGMVHITLYVLATVLIFHVPLRGSLPLLYGSAVFFLAAVVGMGLFISALCTTQQQAILGAFVFLAPATLLSGFATPIENMPSWLQVLTLVNPLRYFLVVTRGVFLKAMPWPEVAHATVPMAILAAVTLTAAAWLFRSRME